MRCQMSQKLTVRFCYPHTLVWGLFLAFRYIFTDIRKNLFYNTIFNKGPFQLINHSCFLKPQ